MGFYPQAMAGHVVIAGIVPNGPAAKSGLQQGDIILSVDQKDVRTRQELYREMWRKQPGERISLRILRDDQSFELDIVGGNRADRYRT
jgi:S1-C subfamily serine protease